ncbi:MAG: DUF721 domain-containing protein [Deinococcota bacterium]|nr:DUF721 domain-containing protein [Deinococcota bacterium]
MATRPSRVGDLIGEVFARGGMKRGVRRAEAVLLWPHVAGTGVAKFSKAASLRDGVLFVEVPDSETAMHLSLQRQRFLDVYRGKFAIKDVREIRFRVGRRAEPEGVREPPGPEIPADPRALALLARELSNLDLPDSLARPTLQAAKSMLAYRARRLADGWRACPICAALTPAGEVCETCRRYGEQERVRRAAQRLAVQPDEPTPLLSAEERQVAAYRARGYLEEQLSELLPQVLADPAMKPFFLAAARCYLAHELGKRLSEVDDDDFDRLDGRIARALGRWA